MHTNFKPRSHAARPAQHQRSGFKLWELLAAIGIVAVLIALLIPAVRSNRPEARRIHCKNNLKQIGLALHHYHDQHGGFPPAYTVDADGQPLHSWRTLILPYLDEQALYDRIDLSKPWDDPVNLEAGKTRLSVYRCFEGNSPETHTNYLALVGENHSLHPTQSRQLSEVSNETSDTLMVVEVASTDAVPWMSPLDADEKMVLGLASQSKPPHRKGSQALFMDGAVQFLNAETPAAERRAQLRISKDGD